MKKRFWILALMPALALAGCKSAGYDGDTAVDIITPSAAAKTTVRTWDAGGTPQEQTVKNDPAFVTGAKAKDSSR